jgi:hypothetical protein
LNIDVEGGIADHQAEQVQSNQRERHGGTAFGERMNVLFWLVKWLKWLRPAYHV